MKLEILAWALFPAHRGAHKQRPSRKMSPRLSLRLNFNRALPCKVELLFHNYV